MTEEDFCIGPLNTNDKNRTWFIPHGKNPDQCTYCKYCWNNNKFDKSQVYEWKGLPLTNCSCDGEGYKDYSINVDNICVSVWDAELKRPFNKLTELHIDKEKLQEAENKNILLVDMPSNIKYKIRIIRGGNKIEYFTIENGKIGDIEISGLNRCLPINNQTSNLRIYNAIERVVKGVNVGDNGFTFISDNDELTLEVDKASKLTFTIQKWEREPRSIYNIYNNPFRNMIQAGQDTLSDIVNRNTNNVPINLGSSNVLGSMTGVSNSNIGDVFVKTGLPIDITIQLICLQDDDMKIQRNLPYYENRLRIERRLLHHEIKKLTESVDKYDLKIQELTRYKETRQKKLEDKLNKYEKIFGEKYTGDTIDI